MNLSTEVINEFVKVTNDKEQKKEETTVFGTVVSDGGRFFVRLDGSDALTPIATTSTIKAGERVVVAIKNHSAMITGNVTDPSASSEELHEASIKIDGMEIRMKGFVTFEGLSGGTTTVDGACIQTGKIDAERLNLTEAITWNSFSPTLVEDINVIEDRAAEALGYAELAKEAADTAQEAADEVLVTVSGFTITEGQDTYIDGDMIYSESIYADKMHLGGELTVYKTMYGTRVGGYMGYCEGWDSAEGIAIMNDVNTGQCVCTDEAVRISYGGESEIYVSPDVITINPNNLVSFQFAGDELYELRESYFAPVGGYQSLGTEYGTWTEVFADTGEVSVSDRNLKNSIEDLPKKYVAMFDSLQPRRFKLNNGTSDRYHVGYISQEVEEAMTTAGIDSKEFGGFVKGKDAEGNDIYMLRYSEFGAIYAAKIKQLEDRIAELEAKLSK